MAHVSIEQTGAPSIGAGHDARSPLEHALTRLGEAGLARAASTARGLLSADLAGPVPWDLDPSPLVLSADEWAGLAAGLVQRTLVLDALLADLYGPRSVITAGIAPARALFEDPRLLRTVGGMPAVGEHRLLAVAVDIVRGADGSWQAESHRADVPGGIGVALEVRRSLQRSVPSLYRSTAIRRLLPALERVRAGLGARVRAGDRAGRTVVVTDAVEPIEAFDHRTLADTLGLPVVDVADLAVRGESVRVQSTSRRTDEVVDAIVRLIPSHLLDPLDLGPTPLGGVTGLTATARAGGVQVMNPLGAGILENDELRAALPDLCRHLLHEDLRLRDATPGSSAGPDAERLTLVVIATDSGFEVLPGGFARRPGPQRPVVRDVWVLEDDTQPDARPAILAGTQAVGAPWLPLPAPPSMSRRTGSDMFWFGRYLERTGTTARVLRAVAHLCDDLETESASVRREVLEAVLPTVAAVTSPPPERVDSRDREAVRAELREAMVGTDRPGGLSHSAANLERTARTLRGQLSADVWPALAETLGRVGSVADGEGRIEVALTDVVTGCLAAGSAVDEEMTRGPGHDLVEAGRRIERAQMLLSLLSAVLARPMTGRNDPRALELLAVITGTAGAVQRRGLGPLRPEALLDTLLREARRPRSLPFQLESLRASLERLPASGPVPESRALLADLRARVAAWDAAELLTVDDDGRTALPDEARSALALLREIADALEDELFRAAEKTSPWGTDDV